MLARFLNSLMGSLLFAVPLLAQTHNDSKLQPMATEVRLHDGTILCKAEIRQNLEVLTRDGKLTVLAKDIQRVEFALRLSQETAGNITQAVEQLASASFLQRDEASKKLLASGYRAYPALQTAAKSKDLEVARRAADALNKIRETAAPELLQLKDHDVIHTRNRQIITGRIQDSTIKVQTPSLGEMSLNLVGLLSLEQKNAEIRVGAILAGSSIQWHDTGILLESDTPLVIRATGEIIHPQSFGLQLITGPHGRIDHLDEHHKFYPPHPPGTLVGKIGNETGHFIIGTHFEGKTNLKGRLYLWVVPWVETEGTPTGSYQVEVAVGTNLNPKSKKLAPLTDDTRNSLRPFQAVQNRRIEEVKAWKKARQLENDPGWKEKYRQAIDINMAAFEKSEKEMRKEFSHILYPEQWLEAPASGIRWGGGFAP